MIGKNRNTHPSARSSVLPRVALLGAWILAAVGCAKIPATHYYVIEWPAGVDRVSVDARPEPVRIGVRDFLVDPPYDQDRIVYRIGDDSVEVGFYAYHRWAVPLSRAMPGLVVDALADDRTLVEPLVSGTSYDRVVEGRLVRLEEVDRSTGPAVRVEVELRWYDGEGSLLGSKRAVAEEEAPGDEVRVVVARMADAVAAAVREAASGIR